MRETQKNLKEIKVLKLRKEKTKYGDMEDIIEETKTYKVIIQSINDSISIQKYGINISKMKRIISYKKLDIQETDHIEYKGQEYCIKSMPELSYMQIDMEMI